MIAIKKTPSVLGWYGILRTHYAFTFFQAVCAFAGALDGWDPTAMHLALGRNISGTLVQLSRLRTSDVIAQSDRHRPGKADDSERLEFNARTTIHVGNVRASDRESHR
jgi:hypothetical protein